MIIPTFPSRGTPKKSINLCGRDEGSLELLLLLFVCLLLDPLAFTYYVHCQKKLQKRQKSISF